MQTARELFLHELSDMLDAEHKILDALSEQSEESSNTTLRSAFEAHHKQTETQVQRLEQCFELIDEEPEDTECDGIKGLLEEHEGMVDEDPASDILDVFNVAAAIKVERYEISSYESLIRLAELLKQTKVIRLLNQNLKEEEQTLKKMMTFATKIKPKNLEPEDEGLETEAQADESDEVSAARNDSKQKQPGPQIVKRSGTRRHKAA